MNFSEQKQLVKKFYADLDAASEQDLPAIVKQYCGADYFWRGFHPFNELQDAEQVATTFWQPLRTALTSLQRRMDIFMAGENKLPNHEGV